MISARRRSRQLAMNRIRVAKNSRNSVKVGDRNSSVGCTHSNFGIWNALSAIGAAEHALQLLPEPQRPVEHMQLVLQDARRAPAAGGSIPSTGEAIRPTMKIATAPTAVTIRTADSERGNAVAARESAPPATAWCRPRRPSRPGERTPWRNRARRRRRSTSSATSAKATTSARRITGGSSVLLSGNGAAGGFAGERPRSRSGSVTFELARSGRTRNRLSPARRRLQHRCREAGDLAAA